MTVRPKIRTSLRSSTAAAALLLLLAGCGSESAGTAPATDETTGASESESPSADGPATDQPWVARFETGGDEVSDGVAYVRFDPASGETRVTEITSPPQDYEPNPFLVVDAGRTTAVLANASSIKEERTGTVRLWSLTGGKARTVDLREVTGVDDLHPIGWAFDPAEPGLLRVLDRSGRLFEWQVDGDSATEADEVEVPEGSELAPYFDSATGLPLLRDSETYEVAEGGPYAAGGVTEAKTDKAACPAGTSLASTAEGDDGSAWTGCLTGDKVTLLTRPAGADAYEEAGASQAKVPEGTMTLSWVLPTVG